MKAKNRGRWSIFFVIVVILISLVGYASISYSAFVTHRAELLMMPHPTPSGIVAIEPAPSSTITNSVFNQYGVNHAIGNICIKITGNGLVGSNVTNSLHLKINEKSAIAYSPWKDKYSDFNSIESGSDLDTGVSWTRICWPVILAPGDYLAELSIESETAPLKYEWAFQIIDK